MFTGIVEDTGSVVTLSAAAAGRRLVVQTALDLGDTKLGDSIAVDGVCLTVVEQHRAGTGRTHVAFDVGPETLAVTAFGRTLRPGRRVHLERALRLSDRLGGHLVSGHVDGVGQVAQRRPQGDALFLDFTAPAGVLDLCIPKGSIAIDGTSLTLNVVDDRGFQVCLIPHTLQQTHLVDLREGDVVNLESDMIGKYVRRLLSRGRSDGAGTAGQDGVTWDLLDRAGFSPRSR
jgi:riboflavin synthase